MQFENTKQILTYFSSIAASILSMPEEEVSRVSSSLIEKLGPALEKIDTLMKGKDVKAISNHLLSGDSEKQASLVGDAMRENLALMVLKVGFAFGLENEGKIEIPEKDLILKKIELLFKAKEHSIEIMEDRIEKNHGVIRNLVQKVINGVKETSLGPEDHQDILNEKKASETEQDVDLLIADLVAIAWAIVDKEKQPNIENILKQMAPWVKQKRALVNLERFKERNTAMTKRMLEEILSKVDGVKDQLGTRLAKTVTPDSAYEETPQVEVHKYASEDKAVEKLFAVRSQAKQFPDNKSTEVWDYLKSPKGKGSDPLKEVLGGV